MYIHIYLYTYVYSYTCIYMYIYIYTQVQKKSDRSAMPSSESTAHCRRSIKQSENFVMVESVSYTASHLSLSDSHHLTCLSTLT